MKKIWMMILVLAVAAPCVFAQVNSDQQKRLEMKITRNVNISKVQTTAEEKAAVKKALESINNLRKYFAEQKEENALMHMQHLVGFYEGFAYDFAANEDIDRAFEAKNPELVKMLAKEMQKPIQVGWAEDKTIVLGSYIADQLPEAYNHWFVSEPADELDAFNRDVLSQAAN